MHDCDVAIIGGGPGGSCLAGLLALRGYRVTLVEREAFPRFTIGESLLPQSCGVFQQLGVMDALTQRFMRKNGATFACSTTKRVCHFAFSDAFDKRFDHAFQVRRDEFDALLLNRARTLGVTVMQPRRVTKVLFEAQHASGLMTQTGAHDSRTIQARFVVDASGRSALMANARGGRQRIEGLNQSSVYAHYRNVRRQAGERTGNVEVLMLPQGWLWVIPFKNNISSVGAVMHNTWFHQCRSKGMCLGSMLDTAIASSPWARLNMKQAQRLSEPTATADFSYRCARICGPGWLALGDAAGFVDPLFSSGVHLAVRGAQLARDVIDQCLQHPANMSDALQRYHRTMTRAVGLFLGAVQSTYNGRLRELIFAPERRPLIRRMITSLLAGDVFHSDGDLPVWVRSVNRMMLGGGIDKLAAALQAGANR